MTTTTHGAAPAPGARQPGFLQGISLLMPITLSVMAGLFVAPVAPNIAQHYIARDPAHAGTIAMLVELLVTVPALCVALFSPLAGQLGDKLGRRRLLMWSMGIYLIVGVAPYFMEDLRLIVATRVVVGLVEAMLMTLSTTLIGDYFDGEARNRWLAAQTGVASTTAVLVLMVAGAVGQSDWHNVFLLYLIPGVFLGMVALFTWEPEQTSHLHDPGKHLGWGDLPWGILGTICAITLFGSIMFYTVQIKLPSALMELGLVLPDGSYDAARGARLTALASLFVPVGTVCFWVLSPRARIGVQFVIEFALIGIGYLAMSRLADPFAFALAAGISQIGAGMLLPTLLTWAVSRLPFEVRGRGTGIWTSTFSLGQFVCNNAAVPLIMLRTGSMIGTLGVLGIACIAAAALAVVLTLAQRR
ncbi:MAG: hypothetical protein RIS94_2351 [Pseudomonadota bacterium]